MFFNSKMLICAMGKDRSRQLKKVPSYLICIFNSCCFLRTGGYVSECSSKVTKVYWKTSHCCQQVYSIAGFGKNYPFSHLLKLKGKVIFHVHNLYKNII